MAYCVGCGSEIPEGQRVCSMCYGDPFYGNDGYYLDWLKRELEDLQSEEDQYIETLEYELFDD